MQTRPTNSTDSLYRQAMADEFHSLAPELQLFHSLAGRVTLPGRCTVKGPHTTIGRLFGKLFALPKATTETDFWFELDADTRQETWRRHFPGRSMTSQMRIRSGSLVESLGPVDLHFQLSVLQGQLRMIIQRITFCELPCPKFLLPSILAEETGAGGKLYFNVAATLPLVGILAEYRGYLDLEQAWAIA